MKIKKIELINNQYFGNATFEFTNEDGNIMDNVILAGKNGCGKTQLLNLIYDFSALSLDGVVSSEIRKFTVGLTDDESQQINSVMDAINVLFSDFGELEVVFDFTVQPNYWNRIKVKYYPNGENNDGGVVDIDSSRLFSGVNVRKIFKAVFSTVEINYTPRSTSTITAQEIDEDLENSLRSSDELATEIQQLFIDISTNDAMDLQNWVNEHETDSVPSEVRNRRINRFKHAFATVFDDLNFYKITTENNMKKVIFKKKDQEVDIASLSSGEKQIVFRGAFLIRNQESIKGNIILIDEPEISLHPTWQKKILNYYRNLFVDERGNQNSQIFIATHSQYVLSSALLINGKTSIILMKRTNNSIETKRISAPLVLPSITSAELNYTIFDIISNDYHIELYGYLQQKAAEFYGKDECSIKKCDEYITRHSAFDETVHRRESRYKATRYFALPTYIRNAIDHPEPDKTFTEEELRRSIELLIELCL